MQTYKELLEKVVKLDYIKYSIDVNNIIENHGNKVFLFVMEECSEVQGALLENDRDNIVEESVDLLIVLSWLRIKSNSDVLSSYERNFCTSEMPVERALKDLAVGIKTISKVLRSECDLNSSTMQECIIKLNKVATCLLADNDASEKEIQQWLIKKISKIEHYYKESKGGVC